MRSRKSIVFVMAVLGLLALAAVPQPGASRLSADFGAAGTAQGADESVPAFHSEVPKGPLPATMDPEQFSDPVVRNAYTSAAKVKKVLYQQPCYCHCDRSQGHGSLLDCFVSKHAAGCNVCTKEEFYSSEQAHKGKTGAQIRDGIEKGEWQQVDLSKYQGEMKQ